MLIYCCCVSGAAQQLRPYLPNLDFGAFNGAGDEAEGVSPAAVAGSPGKGLALVALRDVRDEEILLNYRRAASWCVLANAVCVEPLSFQNMRFFAPGFTSR